MVIFRKTVWVSLTVGFVGSFLLWILVVLSGEIVPGGQSHTTSTLHHLQQPGVNLASSWFPCAASQASAGCEYLKIIPTMILLNGLMYAGVLFLPIYLFRFFSTSLD